MSGLGATLRRLERRFATIRHARINLASITPTSRAGYLRRSARFKRLEIAQYQVCARMKKHKNYSVMPLDARGRVLSPWSREGQRLLAMWKKV